jgi:HTH-type transcriptional regulator/antitoxin HigA
MEGRVMKKEKIDLRKRVPKRYRDLVSFHMPRPLHDRVDYDNTCDVVEWLMVMDEKDLNEDQGDYLDALMTFIEKYDNEHSKLNAKNFRGIKALKYLLDINGINKTQFSELLGKSKSLGGLILNGQRELTKSHLKILSERFKVDAQLFID